MPASAKNELDFAGFEEVVDGDGHGAGLEDAEEGRDELRAVLQPDSDAISGLDAKIPDELFRHPQRARLEFSIGELGVAQKSAVFCESRRAESDRTWAKFID